METYRGEHRRVTDLQEKSRSITDAILMLPSTARDFLNKDPKTLALDFVNPTGLD